MTSKLNFKTLLVCSVLSLAFSSAAARSATGSFEQSYTADGPVRLDLSTGSGSIDIRSGDASHIKVIGKIKVGNRSFLGLFKRSGEDNQAIVDQLKSSPPVSFENGILEVGYITVQGKISKKHLRGDVRGGGDRLRIKTGSGGIRVN